MSGGHFQGTRNTPAKKCSTAKSGTRNMPPSPLACTAFSHEGKTHPINLWKRPALVSPFNLSQAASQSFILGNCSSIYSRDHMGGHHLHPLKAWMFGSFDSGSHRIVASNYHLTKSPPSRHGICTCEKKDFFATPDPYRHCRNYLLLARSSTPPQPPPAGFVSTLPACPAIIPTHCGPARISPALFSGTTHPQPIPSGAKQWNFSNFTYPLAPSTQGTAASALSSARSFRLPRQLASPAYSVLYAVLLCSIPILLTSYSTLG